MIPKVEEVIVALLLTLACDVSVYASYIPVQAAFINEVAFTVSKSVKQLAFVKDSRTPWIRDVRFT